MEFVMILFNVVFWFFIKRVLRGVKRFKVFKCVEYVVVVLKEMVLVLKCYRSNDVLRIVRGENLIIKVCRF